MSDGYKKGEGTGDRIGGGIDEASGEGLQPHPGPDREAPSLGSQRLDRPLHGPLNQSRCQPLSLGYQALLEEGHLVADAAQARAVEALDALQQELAGGVTSRGLYLWGPVGRGKTWLMDLFVDCSPVTVRRWHFHHFMRWVHQRQFYWRGQPDPLARLAEELSAEVGVLCLDEVFVEDIADAMLLGGLMQQLFARRLTLVATSNQPPAELYRDGFNRERFLPAIAAMQAHLQVLELDGGQDHRRHPGDVHQRYFVRRAGDPGILSEQFVRLSGRAATPRTLALGGRKLEARGLEGQVLWCDFAALCEAPLAALDFIALCDRFDTLLLGEVPCLASRPDEDDSDGRAAPDRQPGAPRPIARGTEDASERVAAGDRVLPPLGARDDSVRRFIALVDECYDRRVPLVIEASVAMEELYPDGYLAFAFRRTLSRLGEMQLARFGQRRLP